MKADAELKEREVDMLKAREENDQMTNDLAYMLELIRKIDKAKRDGEEQSMLSKRSSWQTFVPQAMPFRISRINLRRSSSAMTSQSLLSRSPSTTDLKPKPKRKSSNFF